MNKKNWFVSLITNSLIGVMLLFLAMISFSGGVRAVFNPNSELVIYHGNVLERNISLMINVYWGNEYLPSMLTTLQKHNVKTTFFVGGSWVSKFPEDFLSIFNSGHEIGNHGFFHKNHDKLSLADNQKEILNTHKLIKEYTGLNMTLFAPPSGAFNLDTIKAATDNNYKVIMWTRDTIDWRDKDADVIYNRAIKNMAGGDLILMHPTAATSRALEQILCYCEANNFGVVPVSNCI